MKTEKQQKRDFYLQKRNSLCQAIKAEADEKICNYILGSPEFTSCDALLAYFPIKNEIDIRPIITEALRQNKSVALPRCNAGSIMSFHIIHSLEGLSLNGKYKIPEPSDEDELLVPTESSLCIVPALIYDLSGFRLGYGGGYYDRFLAGFKGKSIGVIYSHFIEEALIRDNTDINVEKIITEGGIVDCKNEQK